MYYLRALCVVLRTGSRIVNAQVVVTKRVVGPDFDGGFKVTGRVVKQELSLVNTIQFFCRRSEILEGAIKLQLRLHAFEFPGRPIEIWTDLAEQPVGGLVIRPQNRFGIVVIGTAKDVVHNSEFGIEAVCLFGVRYLFVVLVLGSVRLGAVGVCKRALGVQADGGRVLCDCLAEVVFLDECLATAAVGGWDLGSRRPASS